MYYRTLPERDCISGVIFVVDQAEQNFIMVLVHDPGTKFVTSQQCKKHDVIGDHWLTGDMLWRFSRSCYKLNKDREVSLAFSVYSRSRTGDEAYFCSP